MQLFIKVYLTALLEYNDQSLQQTLLWEIIVTFVQL